MVLRAMDLPYFLFRLEFVMLGVLSLEKTIHIKAGNTWTTVFKIMLLIWEKSDLLEVFPHNFFNFWVFFLG